MLQENKKKKNVRKSSFQIAYLLLIVGGGALSNAYVARFSGMHKAALPLPRRRKFAADFIRICSTCASPYIYSSSPCIYPLSPVLSAHITASDAPQRSDEWFALRKDKPSTFSTALGIWKGNWRCELWCEKVFALDLQETEASKKGAMEWGVLNESTAIERYKSTTSRGVSSLGFAIHSKEWFDWIGASPDGLLGCFPGGGILEVLSTKESQRWLCYGRLCRSIICLSCRVKWR